MGVGCDASLGVWLSDMVGPPTFLPFLLTTETIRLYILQKSRFLKSSEHSKHHEPREVMYGNQRPRVSEKRTGFALTEGGI